MPVKTVYDHGFNVLNTLTDNRTGEIVRSESYRLANRCTADAVWSRPFPTPLRDTYLTSTTIRQNPGRYSRPWTYRREGTQLYVYNTDVFTSRTKSDDGNGAFNRALAGFSEFSFGESLVEANKTASMLTKRGNQLDRIGLALLRGDRRALERAMGVGIKTPTWRDLVAMGASRRMANGYNEVSYGWLPVLQAMSDGARAYITGLGGRGQTRRQTRGGGNRIGANADWSNLPDPRGRGTVSGVIRNEHLAGANQLGLLNVPLEIWNKVPYSFVFDWAIPIATYLGGITATAGLGDVRATRVSVTRREQVQLAVQNGLVWSYTQTVVRTPMNAFPTLSGLAHGSAVTFGKVVSSFMLLRARLG